ncbi:MAG TPA: type II toxin-antitoxin system RelE/ParE family toxin [Planktothrix sp.]
MKIREFARDATKEGLTDEQLKKAIEEMQGGLVGDALGGNLYKKRIAENNRGKSGGYRTIILFRESANDVFCLFMFAKNTRTNISREELQALKKLAKEYETLSEKQIEHAIKNAAFFEVR